MRTHRVCPQAGLSRALTGAGSAGGLTPARIFEGVIPQAGIARHIIVAAELTNMAADSGELPAMLDAVRANLDADASCVLADAGYRSEAVFERLRDHPSDLVVALGREGRQDIEIDASRSPCTVAMAAKLQTDEG